MSMYRGIIFLPPERKHKLTTLITLIMNMNIANDNTSAVVRSKDVRQAAIRSYLNYQMAVKARERLEERKNSNNVNFSDHELKVNEGHLLLQR